MVPAARWARGQGDSDDSDDSGAMFGLWTVNASWLALRHNTQHTFDPGMEYGS